MKALRRNFLRVRRVVGWLWVLPLAALVSCVAISHHPLAGVDDIKLDQRLLGAWLLHGNREGVEHYVHIVNSKNKVLTALLVAHEPGGLRTILFEVAPTEIAGQSFASIRVVDEPGDPSQAPDYFLVRYEFNSRGALIVWAMDFHAAIQARQLAKARGRLSDSTAKLREHIARKASEHFISSEPPFKLTKLSDE
ncbi:MAG: hypothetical protein ACREP3_19640 [Candidatus Binatia bacterium]